MRRAWLCGQDELTGRSFEHRRQWVEDRLHLLANSFALSIQAYAVMSNHLHLVVYLQPGAVRRWNDADVIRRWRRVYPVRTRTPPAEAAVDDASDAASKVLPERIAIWRERLGSLSWFMRALVEPIARRANSEDDCTGHFWEARFRCQALLDERSILAAMAYIDLNPVRAGIALTLADSDHTSIALRIRALVEAGSALHCDAMADPGEPLLTVPAVESTLESGGAVDLSIPPDSAPAPVVLTPQREPRLQPVAGLRDVQLFDITAVQYLDLVAWSGSVSRAGKSALIAADPQAALKTIGCTPEAWREQFDAIRCSGRAIGGSAQVRALAERLKQRWLQRRRPSLRTTPGRSGPLGAAGS